MALRRLGGTLSFLQVGAHPDDEASGLLAMLVRKHAIAVGYVCATRGEGGQNALGAERDAALGILRTAEMVAAARRLGISLRWLGDGTDGTLRDFGFSKSAEDTFAHWGRDLVLDRLVRCIRQCRPDILCPAFLDVDGQHGHHRAITRLTSLAFDVSGRRDAFPSHFSAGLEPWSPALLYLPAWSGAGSTYDDAHAPPEGHVHFDLGERDPETGVPYSRIGEWSRACHRSQEMGAWVDAGRMPVALHLLARREGGSVAIDRIGQTLPTDLRQWAERVGGRTSAALRDAHDAIGAAISDDLRPAARQKPLADALRAIRAASAGLDRATHGDLAHRLDLKDRQICRALWLVAFGAIPSLRFEPAPVSPGGILRGRISDVPVGARVEFGMPAGFAPSDDPGTFRVDPGIGAGTPLGWGHEPEGGASDFRATFATSVADLPVEICVDADAPPAIGGAHAQIIRHPHLPVLAAPLPPAVDFAGIGFLLPRRRRIAFVDGGFDLSGAIVRSLGFELRDVGDVRRIGEGDFDCVLVGSRAYERRDDLRAGREALHRFVRAGGTLVTLYQRPGEWWDPQATPLAPIEIGRPSFRWRVARSDAPVEVRLPQHPLLNWPNRLGAEDWAGWRRERGLYFAARWDETYQAPIATADPGEQPLAGGLLSGRFGGGRHTHVALALHNETGYGTPGAFKLLVNLLTPEDTSR
jgi:LmbE family N-acetylglucosaminyl deacetylase